MDDRLYFVVGDHFTSITSGIVVGLFSAWFFDPSWGMFSAMLVGMVLGMLVGFVFPGAICLHYFGLFELMVPLMLTNMLAGMFISMLASMYPLGCGVAGLVGAIIGLAALRLTYRWNNKISGVVSGYERFNHG